MSLTLHIALEGSIVLISMILSTGIVGGIMIHGILLIIPGIITTITAHGVTGTVHI